MAKAYAVMFLDRDARRVRGVGVFSEEHPSTHHFTVPLLNALADTYEEAHQRALAQLKDNPEYAWLQDVIEWERGKLGRSEEPPVGVTLIDQKLKALAAKGCPFCPVQFLCVNLQHEFTICPKCGCRRYLDGRTTDPIKKGVKKTLPSEHSWSGEVEDRLAYLEENMERVLGHLVLD